MNRGRILVLCAIGLLVVVAITFFRVGDPRTTAKWSAKASPAVPVVTRVVDVADFPLRRRTIGTFESPATVVIKSRIDSQVLEQHVTDGQIVKKGDLLFTLDDREIRATLARDQATIVKDQAALTQAEAALRRTQELISKQVAPQQQL